jgi:hypothetical protein
MEEHIRRPWVLRRVGSKARLPMSIAGEKLFVTTLCNWALEPLSDCGVIKMNEDAFSKLFNRRKPAYGSRSGTRHLEGSVIMEGEKIAWSHHGGKICGTDDRRTIARECNAAITKSCMNRG